MEVRDGFVDEETDRVYQTSKSELKRHATMDPLWAANRISELETERGSWGNEFSAVMMCKDRIAKLEALLRDAVNTLLPYSKMQGRSLNKNPAEEMIERIHKALV